MSDIQDLIHTTTKKALAAGQKAERERIVKLIEEARSVYKEDTVSYDYLTGVIQVITGER